MSNFMKQGLRKQAVDKARTTKKHVKGFYRILHEMDELAKQLDPSIEYTEDNLNDYIEDIYGRKLDSMEKFLILGKMYHRNKELYGDKD